MSATIHKASRAQALQVIADLPIALSPEQLQFFSLCVQRATHLWCGYIDDEFVGLWGVIPPTLLHSCAYIWLHHTDAVRGKEFPFIRRSRLAMAEVLELYPEIHGHTVVGSDATIRWLRWLGADFGDPQGQLVPFAIRRS